VDGIQARFVGAGLFALVIFLSGYWLTRAGKPYSVILLTLHKLTAVAAFVLLVIALVRANRADALGAAALGAGVVAGVFFVGLIATGGLLSSDLETPAFVRTLHHIAPYLTLVSSAVTLYLLQGG
jgi:hypothetical protein